MMGKFRIAASALAICSALACGCSAAQAEPVEDTFAWISDVIVEHNVEGDETVRWQCLDELPAMMATRAEREAKELAVEQAVWEQVYYEEPYYYEPVYYGPAYGNEFASQGVVYGDDGTRYKWYSQRVLPGGGLDELNTNGRHVDERGFVCDGDGYIAVASDDYAMGTVVETPFGEGKVYDGGCEGGTVDVYTDF